MSNIKEHDNQIWGVVGTVLFHLLLLLAIYFYGLSTVLPYEEEGLTVNYGTDLAGEGLFEPAPMSAIADVVDKSTSQATTTPSTPSNADLKTQNIEESLEVKDKKSETKKETKKPELTEEQKRQQELLAKQEAERKDKEQRTQKASSTIKNAFSSTTTTSGKGTDSQATSQGVVAGAFGNQGKTDGDPNSTNYTGGGVGDGVSYNLGNRKALYPQKPPYNQNISGYIVVEIEVDPGGNVKNAKAGAKGTTISDATMRKEAEETALKTKFTTDTKLTTNQSGTITYKYVLN